MSVLGPIIFTIYTTPLADIIKHHNLSYHFYADDTQLYITFDPKSQSSLQESIACVEKCAMDIKIWMSKKMLKLNDDKTEVLYITSPYFQKSLPNPTLKIDQSSITPTTSARNIGVIFDNSNQMKEHITTVCRASHFHLRNIGLFVKIVAILYMEVLKSLNNLYNTDQNNSRENLETQFVFYNKMLKINERLVYDEELFSAGLWRVCDMFDSNGNLIPFSTWETRGVSGSKFLLWRGLLSKVETYKINMSYTEVIDSSNAVILPTGDIIDMQNTFCNELYGKTIKLRIVQPTAVSCYLDILPGLSSKEIESMFIVPRVCTSLRDNILKELQFKILHRYLPTNDLLFKMKKVNSRKCTFCNLYKLGKHIAPIL